VERRRWMEAQFLSIAIHVPKYTKSRETPQTPVNFESSRDGTTLRLLARGAGIIGVPHCRYVGSMI
jgi:hypothetical protein